MATKITSFESACKVLDRKQALPDVSGLPEKHQKAIVAHYKLITVIEALNYDQKTKKQWEPNWNNTNEWKYWNYFWIDASKEKPSGFGFSASDFTVSYSCTYVGSRLCFKTRELAEYARKQFKELYLEYFLLR